MASFFEKLKKGMGIDIPLEEKIEKKPKEPAVSLKEKPKKESKLPGEQVKKPKRTEAALEVKPIEVKIEEIEKPEAKGEKPSFAPAEVLVEKKAPPKKDSYPPTTLQPKPARPKEERWFEPEGELAIDVYQTEGELVIQSAIAGVNPEDLDISIEEDRVLIKGIREKPDEGSERNYFYQECYWGPFSKQIILPVETDPSRAQAIMKEGILTIRIPKIEREKKRKIIIKT